MKAKYRIAKYVNRSVRVKPEQMVYKHNRTLTTEKKDKQKLLKDGSLEAMNAKELVNSKENDKDKTIMSQNRCVSIGSDKLF